MQTRSGLVHLLDGGVVKLHWRMPSPKAGEQRKDAYYAALVRTTKRLLIARVYEPGKKPSPWFEVKDDKAETVNTLVDWWCSGKAISSIMLR